MINLISGSLFFLAAGYLTSVSILAVYQVLIAIPLAWFTWKAIKTKTFNLPISTYLLIGFTLIAVLSLIVNIGIVPKPSKNFGRVSYFLMGITLIWTLRIWFKESTSKVHKILLNTFFISMTVAGLYSCYGYFILNEPRAKVLTETMRYGYGSGMILLVVLGLILNYKKIPNTLDLRIAIPAFIIGFLGMYATHTRGALLGFLCGLPFLLFFFNKKLGYTIGGAALLLIITLGGFYLFGSGNYESRFLVNKDNSSDEIRRSQWQAAIIATKERPLLGWGLSNFHTQLKRIKNDYDLDGKYYNDAHSHNLFLEIASGTGLIGLLFFCAWLLAWAWEIFFAGGLLRALVFPYGIAFVISSQFEVTFDANNAVVIFFIYAFSLACPPFEKQADP
jgi:O-antigen ligase